MLYPGFLALGLEEEVEMSRASAPVTEGMKAEMHSGIWIGTSLLTPPPVLSLTLRGMVLAGCWWWH